MTLFDGGQRLQPIGTANSNIVEAEANRVAVKYNVALQVKQQYYAVLAAIESRDAAELQMAQATEQFKSSVAKVRAGAATRSDSLRGVVQVGNAQLALITAQTNKETADAALTRLVGSEVPVTADPAGVQENMAALPDSAQLAALARRGPAVEVAQSNVDAAKEAVKASTATYLPARSASYSRTGSGTDPRFGLGDGPFSYNGRLSFSLSYPVFNNFLREQQVVQAKVGDINAQATLRDTQLAAQQSLTQYIGALRGASQRVAVQAASVAAAQHRAERAGKRHRRTDRHHRSQIESVGHDHQDAGRRRIESKNGRSARSDRSAHRAERVHPGRRRSAVGDCSEGGRPVAAQPVGRVI